MSTYPYYHIRAFKPSSYDASFNSFATKVSDSFLIAREGGGYESKKKRFIRPHVHIYLRTILSHVNLRKAFKKAFPDDIKGNKDYSIQVQKKDTLLAYIIKGGNILYQKNIDISGVEPWIDPKTNFQEELIKYLKGKQYECNNCPMDVTSNWLYKPYGYDRYCYDLIKYFREKDRWLPKAICFRIALKLKVISIDKFLHLAGYNSEPFLKKLT